MENKTKAKVISGVISICITLPIWLYLFYKVLIFIQATELMMFLFWVYIPTSVFNGILSAIIRD